MGFGDEGLDMRRVYLADADGGGELAACHHLPQVCPRLIDHVGWVVLLVLIDVLFVGQYPGDLAQVYAILCRQDAPSPDTGGDGVGPHADFLPLQIFG